MRTSQLLAFSLVLVSSALPLHLTHASGLPSKTVVTLDENVSTEALANAIQEQVTNGVPTAFVAEVHGYFTSMADLSTSGRVGQLQQWLRVRGVLNDDDKGQLLLSHLAGVLIADTVSAALTDIRTRQAGPETVQALPAMRDLLIQNEELLDRHSAALLRHYGIEEDVATFYKALLANAEREAEEAYRAKWGKNVIAMQQAARKQTFYPKGLAALSKDIPRQWRALSAEQDKSRVLRWAASVDLYNYQVLAELENVLKDTQPSLALHADPAWSANVNRADKADPRSAVTEVTGMRAKNVLAVE